MGSRIKYKYLYETYLQCLNVYNFDADAEDRVLLVHVLICVAY